MFTKYKLANICVQKMGTLKDITCELKSLENYEINKLFKNWVTQYDPHTRRDLVILNKIDCTSAQNFIKCYLWTLRHKKLNYVALLLSLFRTDMCLMYNAGNIWYTECTYIPIREKKYAESTKKSISTFALLCILKVFIYSPGCYALVCCIPYLAIMLLRYIKHQEHFQDKGTFLNRTTWYLYILIICYLSYW